MRTLVTLLGKNQWFFIPFLLWIVAGAILQCFFFTHEQLFLGINHAHTEWLDVIMTGVTYIGDGTVFGIMLAIMLVMRKFRLFFAAGTLLLLVTLLVQVGKHYYNAPRPLAYFGDTGVIHMVKWVSVHSSCSFPSGHTTTAFAMFCFLSLITRNKLMGGVFILLAFLAAYSRIYLAQHFFIDVYVGSIIGTCCSLLIYQLFMEGKRLNKSPELCQEAMAGNILPNANM